MANTTLTVAAVSGIDAKLVAACGGAGCGTPGASIKAFTATAGSGNYPIAGLTLDLSGLFPNKVLAVVVSPLYDPAVASADLIYPAVYIPDSAGDPATGKVYAARQTAATSGLVIIPDDSVAITGYVVTGFAIGY